MKRFYFSRYITVIVILISLAVACSNGSDSPLSPDDNDQSELPGGRISLGIPIDDGSELVIPVDFSEAEDLYAMSFRIGYESQGLELIDVEWDNIVGDEDATFHNRHQRNFVPLAFARYSGMPGLRGHGTLARLRFRIKNQNYSDPWIIRDREFIRARDSLGNELRLEIGGGS